MEQPNIVFITTHDLGRHLGCYGARTVQSPNLDALAARGVRFEQAFCAAPQCSPARAALATGRYPHANGVMGLSHGEFAWHLPTTETYIARYLKDNGYDTALFGLQHVTSNDKVDELGFDEWELGGQSRAISPKVVQWLHSRHREGPTRKPFYLEIGFGDTHRPWGGNPPDWALGTDRLRWLPPYPGSDEEMARFQGEIYALDRGIGSILDTLDTLGLRDNTWVIFTSDHGIAIPRAKGTLYDPGIEVPLIMEWPAGCLVTGTFSDLVSHVDVLPTILEALNLLVPTTLQGRSLWPMLRGESYQARTEVFAEKTYHTVYDPIRGIRTATHKLIVHFSTYDTADVPLDAKDSPVYEVLRAELTRPHSYIELFDVIQDPLERNNLAWDPASYDTLLDLMRRLRQWMTETEDPLLRGMIASPTYYRAVDMLLGRIPLRDFLAGVQSPRSRHER